MTFSEQADLCPDLPEMIGGIPGSIFRAGQTGAMHTGPGRRLLYAVQQRELWLTYGPTLDQDRSYPHFGAGLIDRQATGMWFSVRNRVDDATVLAESGLMPEEPCHPGLYPARLLGAALLYFEHANREQIAFVRSIWRPDESDNYALFWKGLGARPRSRLALEQAALATWTGRVLFAHGFSGAEVAINQGYLHVVFER